MVQPKRERSPRRSGSSPALDALQQPEGEQQADQVGEEHLGVAQHAEHLDGGDGKAHHPVQPSRDGGAEEPGCLQGGLDEQAAGQGLVAHGGQDEAEEVSQKPPFEQLGRFPLARTHGARQGPPAPHDQPPLPKTPEQHQKGEGGQGESRAEAEGPLGIGRQLVAHLAEEEHTHHHHPKGDLAPEPHPADAPEGGGHPAHVNGVNHGAARTPPNLPWEDQGSESKVHPEARLPGAPPVCWPAPSPASLPVTSLSPPAPVRTPTALALGTFDGLHAGHRRVIQEAIDLGREEIDPSPAPVPTVVSFWPHPREVLYGETRLRLDLPDEKLALLQPLGVEQLVLLPFTRDLACLTPERFVEEVLAHQLKARSVVVGENFRFGVKRSGDVGALARLGRQHGIRVAVVPTLRDGAGRVSSSRIRQALAEGRIADAEGLLGRPYRFAGQVVKGRGLARQLGWPTANLEVCDRKFLPMEGVYAAMVWIDGDTGEGPLAAVMNLGRQPTVDPEAPSLPEVHLLDRKADLLGRRLLVQPLRWLRGQRRFASLEELSEQIHRDVDAGRGAWAASEEAR